MVVMEKARLRTLLSYVGRPLWVMFAFDVAVAEAYVFLGWKWLALPDIPLAIFGGVIGVIAGFRNASAYARWWEARTAWGGVVNHSRSFAREVLTMIAPGETGHASADEAGEMKRNLVRLQIAFVHALHHRLRGTEPWNDLAGAISEVELDRLRGRDNLPLAIQQRIASLISICYQWGWLDNMRWVRLDLTLGNLTDYQGACERIKYTPLPRVYDLFIRLFMTIFCVLLPLGMVQSLKLLTPFGSTFVAFIFFTLDRIGRDLEKPFENLPHDVALTAISRSVEIDLKQMAGEHDVPVPVTAVDGVLW